MQNQPDISAEFISKIVSNEEVSNKFKSVGVTDTNKDFILNEQTKESQNEKSEIISSVAPECGPASLSSEKGDVTHSAGNNCVSEKKGDPVEDLSEKNGNVGEEDEWLDILGSGQLQKKVLRKAENSFRPHNSFICEINGEGCLEDGTVVDKFVKLKIQLGDAEVVQGVDLTLPLMDVGEECLVEVYPRFAYGSLGRYPDVPPNSKLTYRLELLSAEPEPDLESLSVKDRKRIGNQKRERGNWWYSRQDYTFAIQCYRRALEFLDDAEGGINYDPKEDSEFSKEEIHNLFEDRLKVFNNLAAAQMKIKAYDTALQSVQNVLRCQPQNVKALFRKGKILAAKGDNSAAVSVLRMASQLEPENKIIKQELLKLVSLRNEDTKNERNLYKKMLGQEANNSTTKGQSKSYQFRWGILFGSVAAVVAGMMAYRYKFL